MLSTSRLRSLAAFVAITAAGTGLAAVPSIASASPVAPSVQLSQASHPATIGLLLPAVQSAREAARR